MPQKMKCDNDYLIYDIQDWICYFNHAFQWKQNKLDFNPWNSRVILATCIQRQVVKHSSSFLWEFKIEILHVVLRILKCFVLTLDHSRLFLKKWKWLFGLWFSFKILCSSLHFLSPKMIFLDCFDAWKT